MIDHASTDLWIMPKGTKCFEDPSLLTPASAAARWRSRAWRRRSRCDRLCRLADAERLLDAGIRPSLGFAVGGLDLGTWWKGGSSRCPPQRGRPSTAPISTGWACQGWARAPKIRQQSVRVAAVTNGIRSSRRPPNVFMDVDRARAHTGVPSSKATYFLVRAGQGADVRMVRRNLLASLTDVEVLTPSEFRERSRSFWLFGTGAGAALVRGRAARRHSRHGDRRADALFQHQGAPQRVCHAPRHRLVPQIHL